MTRLRTPMERKAFRFHQDDLNNLAHLAKNADMNESEKLRELIRSAAGSTQKPPDTPIKKQRRTRAPKMMATLDPDTRLILVRACNLLNQAVKALHVSRHLGREIDLVILGMQLVNIEELLIKVGQMQINVLFKNEESSL